MWGAATAAYQIEGAWNEDGKGESIWDQFVHASGNIKNEETGDITCDHYHQMREDVALMKSLGLKAYRFSIAWTRILPQGRGAVNQAGLDFYSDLVDELCAAGITPFVTLYHWDLPQVLQDQGGWSNRETVDAFVEYAETVTSVLGNRVKHWVTHNEPWVVAMVGHQMGTHAPGIKDWYTALRVAHHLMLSHGRVVPVIRHNSPGCEVGITLDLKPIEPLDSTEGSCRAARYFDGLHNRWFLDPVFGRHYPSDMVEEYTHRGYLPDGLDYVQPGDYETMAVHTDFLGVNYYRRLLAYQSDDDAGSFSVLPCGPEGAETTDFFWEVYPDGLYNLLSRLYLHYQPQKIYITENGASYEVGPDHNSIISDTNRICYIERHLDAVYRAAQAGVPVCGYMVWTLMDNFEWAEGFQQRFGIVWTDFETRERILKESARWYREVIRRNGLVDSEPEDKYQLISTDA